MKKTVEILTTWEAIRPFLTEEMKEEYSDCESYRNINIEDDMSIQDFLDTDAQDTERLSQEMCEFFNLNYSVGYYISTWKGEYLTNG